MNELERDSHIDQEKLYKDISHLIEKTQRETLQKVSQTSGAEKSEERVELLQLENSGIRVCQYITELPAKELFEARLHDAIKRARERCESRKLLGRNDE